MSNDGRAPSWSPETLRRSVDSTTISSIPGTMLKNDAIDGSCGDGEQRFRHCAAHVGDRRQRHDGIAKPVRREENDAGQGGFHGPPARTGGPMLG